MEEAQVDISYPLLRTRSQSSSHSVESSSTTEWDGEYDEEENGKKQEQVEESHGIDVAYDQQASQEASSLQQETTTAFKADEPCIESLDYDPIHSTVYMKSRKEPQRRRLYGYTGITFIKWTITILIGILVGCLAYIIAYCQEQIIGYKRNWTQNIMNKSLLVAFIGYAGFGMFLITISTCLVLYWAPAAAGGGVTLVMAYLNGNDIPNLLHLRTLVIKVIGTICTISSGMPIGQEGPMVHIGAAVASTLTWMHCDLRSNRKALDSRKCCSQLDMKPLPLDMYNDKDRREFISAGAAAGLAAAFGSPVGGVLYSLEEASSFWSRKVMWRSLVCTTVASLVLSWLHEKAFSFALPGTLSFHGLQPEYVLGDLPLFTITSIGAGVLGALVNISHDWIAYIRPLSSNRFARIVEACSITLFCVAMIFLLPLFFGQCKEVPESGSEFWFAYNCQQESTTEVYNDLATLFFSVPHQTITHLLQLGSSSESYFSVRSLGFHAGSFFIFFILSYGVAPPGGIFMPSMMAGSSFGAFLGTIFKSLFPSGNVQPGLHALIGAASMLGGIFRSTISLVVIIVEGTGGIDFLLPIILAIVVSNWVTHHIHEAGAYEADLEKLGNVHFLHMEPPRELISLSAADIMAQNVLGFEEIVPVTEVVSVLESTQHNGFPVFKLTGGEESGKGGKLVGLILRHQLLVLLEKRAFIEVNPAILGRPELVRLTRVGKKSTQELQQLEDAMRVYHHHHNAHSRGLSSIPEAVNLLGLDRAALKSTKAYEATSEETLKIAALDLRPFMNRAPLTVRGECSAQRVYVIFRTLGLRHLCITDANNKVVGMITRKDLARAHKESKLSDKKGSLAMSDFDMQSFYDKDDKTNLNVLYSLP